MLKTLRIYCNNFYYSLPKSDKEIENRVFLKKPTSMTSIWFNPMYKIKTLTSIQVQGSDKTVGIPAGILCLFAKTPWLKSFSTSLLFYNFKRLRKIIDLVLLWVPNMTYFLPGPGTAPQTSIHIFTSADSVTYSHMPYAFKPNMWFLLFRMTSQWGIVTQ